MSSLIKNITLSPTGCGDGSDRYSQLVLFGEGKHGPVFSMEGKYSITAVYNGGKNLIASRKYAGVYFFCSVRKLAQAALLPV